MNVSGQPERGGVVPDPSQAGYYGLPVIHASHWGWLIIWYFFLGGVSGAAAVIAAFARLFAGPSGASLARTATFVSFAALIPCPALLILDLGRPRRFLNMLRTVRPSSPMSVGSWVLTLFGLVATAATLDQVMLERLKSRGTEPSRANHAAERTFAIIGGVTGFLLAGYTGVLLAATAVPLWSKRPGLLGPLFLSSAMTSGAAAVIAIEAVGGSAEVQALDGLHRFEAMSTIAETVFLTAWIYRLGPTSKPITENRLGSITRHVVVGSGMVAPLVLSACATHFSGRPRRTATAIASILSLTGVFALRYAVVEGGHRSANDPRATFEMTG